MHGIHAGTDRQAIRTLTRTAGITYSGDLVCGWTTHLVVLAEGGTDGGGGGGGSRKQASAREWGIPSVDLDWLLDSIALRKAQPVGPYQLGQQNHQRTGAAADAGPSPLPPLPPPRGGGRPRSSVASNDPPAAEPSEGRQQQQQQQRAVLGPVENLQLTAQMRRLSVKPQPPQLHDPAAAVAGSGQQQRQQQQQQQQLVDGQALAAAAVEASSPSGQSLTLRNMGAGAAAGAGSADSPAEVASGSSMRRDTTSDESEAVAEAAASGAPKFSPTQELPALRRQQLTVAAGGVQPSSSEGSGGSPAPFSFSPAAGAPTAELECAGASLNEMQDSPPAAAEGKEEEEEASLSSMAATPSCRLAVAWSDDGGDADAGGSLWDAPAGANTGG